MKSNIFIISIFSVFLIHCQYLMASELAAKDIVLSNLQVWIDSKESTLTALGEPDSESTLYNEIDDITITIWKYERSEIHFTDNQISSFVLNDNKLTLTKLKALPIGLAKNKIYDYLKKNKLDIIESNNFIKIPIKDTIYYLIIKIDNNSISQLSIWQDN